MSDETRTDEAVPAQRLVVDVTDLRGDTPDLTVPAGDLAVLARAIQAMPLPLVVWAVSPSGLADTVVVTANAASEAFTGLSHLELLGAQLDDLFDDDIAEVMYGHLRHAQRRGVIHSGDWSEQVFRPGSAIDRIWGPTVAKVDDVHVVLVLHDVSERIAHRRELRRKSQYDNLTGLLRRETGLADLDALLARPQASGALVALAYIDLDHFKDVNDTHGHDAGDHVLAETSRRIRATVRTQDSVTRLGGDELLVALPGVHGIADAEMVAHKLINEIALPIDYHGVPLSVTASIGVTLARCEDTSASVLARADSAMFAAKAQGKNAVVSL